MNPNYFFQFYSKPLSIQITLIAQGQVINVGSDVRKFKYVSRDLSLVTIDNSHVWFQNVIFHQTATVYNVYFRWKLSWAWNNYFKKSCWTDREVLFLNNSSKVFLKWYIMGMGVNADPTQSGSAYKWPVFKFYIRNETIKVESIRQSFKRCFLKSKISIWWNIHYTLILVLFTTLKTVGHKVKNSDKREVPLSDRQTKTRPGLPNC